MLDVSITIVDRSITYTTYRKPLNSYLYLPRDSCHHHSVFQGLVAGSDQYAKERSQSKTISKLRDTARQIPRPTQKGKNSPDKGFDLDR